MNSLICKIYFMVNLFMRFVCVVTYHITHIRVRMGLVEVLWRGRLVLPKQGSIHIRKYGSTFYIGIAMVVLPYFGPWEN